MDVDKGKLRLEFGKNWEKHYKLNALTEKGFKRQQCKKCKRYFWAIEERDYCADPSCIGYQFIGNSPAERNLSYVETWKEIEKYFVKHGHESIKPFPTVARWRDDLYFTLASINDFQPYVVNGEIEPIANPLIVPQPCIRFNDIDNVGVTGRHYTNFVMIGQHAFNTEKTGLFYWKEDAIEHDIGYLTYLGIPLEEIVFQEDVWAGGGNFGPSMEYFVKGLELGNCVFMQYEVLPDGSSRELKTKVIDMGAGLSRFAWILRNDPTSYEVVFGKAIEYLKKENSVSYDEKLFLEYAKLSGALNLDEVEDIESVRAEILKKLGLRREEFDKMFNPLQSLYAIADHSLTLLFTIRDGMMPSNSGGGYNLRTLARRMFNLIEKHNFNIDWNKLLNYHMDNLTGLFDEYREAVDVVSEIIEEEKKKYLSQKEKARRKIITILKKGDEISTQQLISLYKSEGIMPEHIKEYAEEKGIKVKIPENFYKLVKEESASIARASIPVDVKDYPKTEKLYYKLVKEFDAEVLGIENNFIILDRTAFYPEGGGQVGDTGYLNNVKVMDTKKKDDVVLHLVENTSSFKKGMKVHGKIDWQRRLDISRHHTVTHLVTAAARQIIGKHVWQAGAKKDENKAHIDLTHYKRITDKQLEDIEKKVNEFILSNLPVIVKEVPRNLAEKQYGFSIYQGGAVPGKTLRLVLIGNVDVEACGGTHHVFNSTSQLGFFKIVKRESVKDGVERIVFKAGRKALEFVQNQEKLLKNASSVFSVNPEDLPSVSERFFKEWKQQRETINLLYSKFAEYMINNAEVIGSFKFVYLDKDLSKTSFLNFFSRYKGVVVTNGTLLIANLQELEAESLRKFFSSEKMKKTVKSVKGNKGFVRVEFSLPQSKESISSYLSSV